VISTVSVALETMPPEVRRKFSEKLPAHHNIKLLPATAWDDEDVPLPQSPLLRAIGDALKREGRDDAQALVLLEDATRALWIKIKVKNQAYWWYSRRSRAFRLAWAWTGLERVRADAGNRRRALLVLRVKPPLRRLPQPQSRSCR